MRRELAPCKSVNPMYIGKLMRRRAKSIHQVFEKTEVVQLEQIISNIEQL